MPLPLLASLIPAGINAVSSFFGANAQNKLTKEQMQLQADALQLEREKDRRAAESDILRKLAQTAYLRGGGASMEPRSVMMGGQSMALPSFGFGPRPASQAQMDSASDLEKVLLERMTAPMVNPAEERKLKGITGFMRAFGMDPTKLEEAIRQRAAANGRADANLGRR
jgi:hypothetical protein